MIAFFGFADKERLFNMVSCIMPTKGHEYLPAIEEGILFKVTGRIEKASGNGIELKDAEVEQINE